MKKLNLNIRPTGDYKSKVKDSVLRWENWKY